MNNFFTLLLCVFVMLGMSSDSIFSMWIFMEMTFYMFLGNLSMNNTQISWVMKFFLIQSMSSLMFLTFYFFSFMSMSVMTFKSLSIPFILYKLGFFPFHPWYLNFIRYLNIKCLMIFLVLMKVIPLLIMSKLNTMFSQLLCLMLFMLYLSMNYYTDMYDMLGISSLFSMAWLFLIINDTMFMMYFFLAYSISLLSFLSLMDYDFIMMNKYNNQNKIVFMLIMVLAMGGIPPFPMFFMKMFTIMLYMNYYFFMLLLLTMSSAIMLYYYLSIIFPMMTKLHFNCMKVESHQLSMTISSFIFIFMMLTMMILLIA